MRRLTAIAAVSRNWGIGQDGQLLFRIPEDLHRFRDLTTGGTVIMGRRTLDSLPGGAPLPRRTTVVLTRGRMVSSAGVLVVHSVKELAARDFPEPCFVAGGGEVYSLLLPYCREALLTRVDADADADVFFPDLNTRPGWRMTERSETQQFEGLAYCFERWIPEF